MVYNVSVENLKRKYMYIFVWMKLHERYDGSKVYDTYGGKRRKGGYTVFLQVKKKSQKNILSYNNLQKGKENRKYSLRFSTFIISNIFYHLSDIVIYIDLL